jgi:hypothetical protein
MKPVPAAHLALPLLLSWLAAIALIASLGWSLPELAAEQTPTMTQRLLGNPFVMAIATVGLWAIIYGLLQVWSLQAGMQGVIARLAGHAGAAPEPIWTQDASLTATLYADRWETHAARRMAPLAYAIWVLPLLGFIGTVIGISDAIGGLGQIFADSDRDEALASVLAALEFAFDTTFAGLALVLPVMALANLMSLKSDALRDRALALAFHRTSEG